LGSTLEPGNSIIDFDRIRLVVLWAASKNKFALQEELPELGGIGSVIWVRIANLGMGSGGCDWVVTRSWHSRSLRVA
jgi:hypothetical protein